MITDTLPLTRESCDFHGLAVAAEFVVTGKTGRTLTFCGHCVRYGVARSLAPFAVPVATIESETSA